MQANQISGPSLGGMRIFIDQETMIGMISGQTANYHHQSIKKEWNNEMSCPSRSGREQKESPKCKIEDSSLI